MSMPSRCSTWSVSRRAHARRRLPARVFGRDAPTGDDRDGSLVQAGAFDRRRADDCTRRDDSGADSRADQKTEAGHGHERHSHYSRPWRRRRHDRSHPGHVRRQSVRAGADARVVRLSRQSLHERLAGMPAGIEAGRPLSDSSLPPMSLICHRAVVLAAL